ncbi:MAG: manganese efflux pump MntP family protein [Halanaerobiales bacterium]
MSPVEMLTTALALGTDAFSVAVAVGVGQYSLWTTARLSITIGIFHVFMPLAGIFGGIFFRSLLAGAGLDYNLDNISVTVGSGLLLLIGFYMIVETRLKRDEKFITGINGWGIYTLALSVSLDSFSAGIGLGMLDFKLYGVLLFGITATIMMASGLMIGSRLGHWLGDGAQIWGGLALIYLGLHFLGYV